MEKNTTKKTTKSKSAATKNNTGSKMTAKKNNNKAVKITTTSSNKKTQPVELKKENSKNLKKEVRTSAPITANEATNLIKIILIVSAIFLIFYGITVIVTKNKKETAPETQDTVIQYDEILLGTLFEQSNSEYYVLVTKSDDEYLTTYTTYLTTYKSKENATRFYTSNLDSGFNKTYIAEESILDTNTLTELKFKESTLLKIKDKKIVSSYEGNVKIIEHLKTLIK